MLTVVYVCKFPTEKSKIERSQDIVIHYQGSVGVTSAKHRRYDNDW